MAAILMPAIAVADSITVTWTATGDDGTSGRASSYDLRFSTRPISGADTTSWWSAAQSVGTLPPPLTAGSREAFTLTGLMTGEVLYFMIRAADETPNWSGYSNVSVRTAGGAGTPLATPSGFGASMTGEAVALRWNEPSSGAGDGYHLYRRTGTAGADSLLAALAVNRTSYTDSGAVAGATYEYRVATYQGSTEGTPAVASISVPTAPLATAKGDVHGFPNPARGSVTLRFVGGTADGAPGRVRLVVYDLTGHRICQILDETVPAGERSVQWACRSDAGSPVAPGLYNVILDGPRGRSVTRLAIVP